MDIISYPTSTQPLSLADYQPIINLIIAGSQGSAPIAITEFDNTTTIPKIKQATVLSILGAWYRASADESINGSIASGDNYIRMPASGTVASGFWTQTAPTWNYQYNCYYDTTNEDMVLPVCVNYDGSKYFKYEILDKFLTTMKDYRGIEKRTPTDIYSSGYVRLGIDADGANYATTYILETGLKTGVQLLSIVDDYLPLDEFVSAEGMLTFADSPNYYQYNVNAVKKTSTTLVFNVSSLANTSSTTDIYSIIPNNIDITVDTTGTSAVYGLTLAL